MLEQKNKKIIRLVSLLVFFGLGVESIVSIAVLVPLNNHDTFSSESDHNHIDSLTSDALPNQFDHNHIDTRIGFLPDVFVDPSCL